MTWRSGWDRTRAFLQRDNTRLEYNPLGQGGTPHLIVDLLRYDNFVVCYTESYQVPNWYLGGAFTTGGSGIKPFILVCSLVSSGRLARFVW